MIEQVKKDTYKRLVDMGYKPETVQKVVNSFWKVIRTYNGKPTAVLTYDGQEIYL
jgi:hypothetical protein